MCKIVKMNTSNNKAILKNSQTHLKMKRENFNKAEIERLVQRVAERFNKGEELRQSVEVLAKSIMALSNEDFQRKLASKFGVLVNSIPSKITKKSMETIKNLVKSNGKNIEPGKYRDKKYKNLININNVKNDTPTRGQVLYVIIVYLLKIPRDFVSNPARSARLASINFNLAVVKLANVITKTGKNMK